MLYLLKKKRKVLLKMPLEPRARAQSGLRSWSKPRTDRSNSDPVLRSSAERGPRRPRHLRSRALARRRRGFVAQRSAPSWRNLTGQ